MTVLVKIRDAGVRMDKNQAQEILKRLQKLIDLMEEQNDIMLFDGNCCPGCDGDCGEED